MPGITRELRPMNEKAPLLGVRLMPLLGRRGLT